MRTAKRRLHFTKTALAALEPEPKRYRVHDSDTKGLTLLVTPAGAKSFYWYGRAGGPSPEMVRIGPVEQVTIEQARRRARVLGGTVAGGGNPAEVKRKRRAEITFGEAWESLVAFTREHRRPNTAREYDRQHKAHLKRWDNRALAEIERSDVKTLIDRVGRTAPYMANRLLATIRRVFNYAAETFDYDGTNPTKNIKRFPEQSRERFLAEHELAAFLDAVDAEPDPTWKDFFRLALYTGARRSNLQAMKWEDVDLAGSAWTVPADESKNGRELRIVLVPEAVAIINERQKNARKAGGKSLYVFPSWGGTGHISEPKKAWTALLQRAGLKNLRLHDLRRSLGSWAAITGGSLLVIGKALGHRSTQSTAVYARVSDAPVREAVNKAVDAMLEAAGRTTKTEGADNGKAKSA